MRKERRGIRTIDKEQYGGEHSSRLDAVFQRARVVIAVPSGETLLRELLAGLLAAPGPVLEEIFVDILGHLGLEVMASSSPAGRRNVGSFRVGEVATHGIAYRYRMNPSVVMLNSN